MKKLVSNILIIVISGIILIILLLFIVLPKQSFSNQENRVLQSRPSFSIDSIKNGSFTEQCTDYITDHFPLRNTWVTVKAGFDLVLGKKESNGIYYGSDGQLFPVFEEPDYSDLDIKLNYIDQFEKSISIPVYFALIPNSTSIQQERLPSYMQRDTQNNVIDYCYSRIPKTINIYSALMNHKNEYIFYRTDHHWTTYGAEIAYQTIMKTTSDVEKSLITEPTETVSSQFYGTSYSSSGYTWIKPDSIDIFVTDDSITVENYINGPQNEPIKTGLYDESCLNKKDKYSYFLGGISPLIHIHKDANINSSLLLIRDSYSDCLAPFFTNDYSDIYLLDLRYYKNSISDFLNTRSIDKIIVIYSVSNLCEDNNLGLLLS